MIAGIDTYKETESSKREAKSRLQITAALDDKYA